MLPTLGGPSETFLLLFSALFLRPYAPRWVQVSLPELKVALALAGVQLTNEELNILERGFRSDRSADGVSVSCPFHIFSGLLVVATANY